MTQRIVIELEGGLVQNVYADHAEGAVYFVVDADTEGAEPERLTTLKREGRETPAYISACEAGSLEEMDPDTRLLLEAAFPEDFPPAARRLDPVEEEP
jgi:hypothetical protein